jgi:hypothetical protein
MRALKASAEKDPVLAVVSASKDDLSQSRRHRASACKIETALYAQAKLQRNRIITCKLLMYMQTGR